MMSHAEMDVILGRCREVEGLGACSTETFDYGAYGARSFPLVDVLVRFDVPALVEEVRRLRAEKGTGVE